MYSQDSKLGGIPDAVDTWLRKHTNSLLDLAHWNEKSPYFLAGDSKVLSIKLTTFSASQSPPFVDVLIARSFSHEHCESMSLLTMHRSIYGSSISLSQSYAYTVICWKLDVLPLVWYKGTNRVSVHCCFLTVQDAFCSPNRAALFPCFHLSSHQYVTIRTHYANLSSSCRRSVGLYTSCLTSTSSSVMLSASSFKEYDEAYTVF
ncbi:hypothetical protein J3A83DRAFT_974096 [Scleroderma citrinum]